MSYCSLITYDDLPWKYETGLLVFVRSFVVVVVVVVLGFNLFLLTQIIVLIIVYCNTVTAHMKLPEG